MNGLTEGESRRTSAEMCLWLEGRLGEGSTPPDAMMVLAGAVGVYLSVFPEGSWGDVLKGVSEYAGMCARDFKEIAGRKKDGDRPCSEE